MTIDEAIGTIKAMTICDIPQLEEAIGIAIECMEKAEKYRWHDLRKDPEDLPRTGVRLSASMPIIFEDLEGDQYLGCFYKYGWFADFCDDRVVNVIAWREIGPFDEV